MKRLTVVIPHLNQRAALMDCLDSLGKQTIDRGQFDIIVVDNGSSEVDLLRTELAAHFDDVQLAEEVEPGPGKARNRGIRLANTNLIACIDADCIADKDWVRSAIARLEHFGIGTAHGGDVRVHSQTRNDFTPIEAYETVFAYRQKMYIERHGFSGTGNLAFWKADFGLVGPFKGLEIAEDVEWGHRARAKGIKILYAPELIVYHPARKTFDELATKWRRHIAHELRDRSETTLSPKYVLLWVARAILIGGSWLPGLFLVWVDERLPGIRARLQASLVLIRIRLFRAVEMFRQLMTNKTRALEWNR